MPLLTLLLALALVFVLLNRLGAFRRIRKRQEDEDFESTVLQLGEEHAWKEHIQRMDRRLPAIHKLPSIEFKTGRHP